MFNKITYLLTYLLKAGHLIFNIMYSPVLHFLASYGSFHHDLIPLIFDRHLSLKKAIVSPPTAIVTFIVIS